MWQLSGERDPAVSVAEHGERNRDSRSINEVSALKWVTPDCFDARGPRGHANAPAAPFSLYFSLPLPRLVLVERVQFIKGTWLLTRFVLTELQKPSRVRERIFSGEKCWRHSG